jgi:nitrate reductase gamma subunit
MPLFIQIVAYVCLAVFVVAIGVRFRRIRSYPLHVRWEIYPVPHEGARAKHGGSRLEEGDWWTKEHKPDKLAELRSMLPEMIFIKALFEHNRKLWYRSFPFHFGLYILVGFLALIVVRVVFSLAGVSPDLVPPVLVVAVGVAGFVLALGGAASLLLMRLTDPGMRPYSNVSHYFNLLLFLVALGLTLAGWARQGWSLVPFESLVGGLLTFSPPQEIGGGLIAAGMLATLLLVAYIPLTHMSHFFVKWFTWHNIRWDDEPNVRGGRIEKLIQDALTRPVSWSAPHIGADGKKTWADVATEEEQSS